MRCGPLSIGPRIAADKELTAAASRPPGRRGLSCYGWTLQCRGRPGHGDPVDNLSWNRSNRLVPRV